MTITDLLTAAAALVAERKTIEHGGIRQLYTNEAAKAHADAEGIDPETVGTGTIGDDGLGDDLATIAEDADRIMQAEAGDLAAALTDLCDAYHGDDVLRYIDRDAENELEALDDLIDKARAFVDACA